MVRGRPGPSSAAKRVQVEIASPSLLAQPGDSGQGTRLSTENPRKRPRWGKRARDSTQRRR